MAENEQLPENATIEQSEIGENAAGPTAEEKSEIGASGSDEVQDASERPVITELKATIKIEGQEFELEAELAQDDKLLKTILQPHFASVENANITVSIVFDDDKQSNKQLHHSFWWLKLTILLTFNLVVRRIVPSSI